MPAFATLAEAVAATGPFDLVDVFRRSELCVPHAREAVAAGRPLPVAPARRRRTGRRRGSPTTPGWRVVMDRCTAIEWRRIRPGAEAQALTPGLPARIRQRIRNPRNTSTTPAIAISRAPIWAWRRRMAIATDAPGLAVVTDAAAPRLVARRRSRPAP